MRNNQSAFLRRVSNAFHQNVVLSEIRYGDNLIGSDVLIACARTDRSAPIANVHDDVSRALNQRADHAGKIGIGIGIAGVDTAFTGVECKGQVVVIDGGYSCEDNLGIVIGNLHLNGLFSRHNTEYKGPNSGLIGNGHRPKSERRPLGLRSFGSERFGLPIAAVTCIAKNGFGRLYDQAAVVKSGVQLVLCHHQLAARSLSVFYVNLQWSAILNRVRRISKRRTGTIPNGDFHRVDTRCRQVQVMVIDLSCISTMQWRHPMDGVQLTPRSKTDEASRQQQNTLSDGLKHMGGLMVMLVLESGLNNSKSKE